MLKRFLMLIALAMVATLARASTMEDEVRAVFDKYIAIQNAHDLKGMRNLLSDSPDMLWISRGKPIWFRTSRTPRPSCVVFLISPRTAR